MEPFKYSSFFLNSLMGNILSTYPKIHPLYLDLLNGNCGQTTISRKGISQASDFVGSLMCNDRNFSKCVYDNNQLRRTITDEYSYRCKIGYYQNNNDPNWSAIFTNGCDSSVNGTGNFGIFSGFHTTVPTIRGNGSSVFITNYYNNIPNAFSEIELILNGITFRAELLYGTKNSGIYVSYHKITFEDYECAQYYFSTKDINGINHRYPTYGFLQFTRDETKCASWVDDSFSTSISPATSNSIITSTSSSNDSSGDDTDLSIYGYLVILIFCIYVVSTIISSMK